MFIMTIEFELFTYLSISMAKKDTIKLIKDNNYEMNAELIRKVQEGDSDALNMIIEKNLPLVNVTEAREATLTHSPLVLILPVNDCSAIIILHKNLYCIVLHILV